MQLSVRRAEARDVPSIERLVAEAYRPYVARIGRPPAPMLDDYTAAVRSKGTWVAEAGTDVVGLLVLVPMPGYLLLENVAVAPTAQGTGVGARLLRLAEDQASAAGLAEIRLYTNETMTENLAYYPRHGYTETARIEEHGYRRVHFSKRLDR